MICYVILWYIYIYTYIDAYLHIYLDAYLYIYTHTCIHICISYAHMCMCMGTLCAYVDMVILLLLLSLYHYRMHSTSSFLNQYYFIHSHNISRSKIYVHMHSHNISRLQGIHNCFKALGSDRPAAWGFLMLHDCHGDLCNLEVLVCVTVPSLETKIAVENRRKTIGKWWLNGFSWDLPCGKPR